MTHKQLQDEILKVLPSKSLKTRIEELGYIFSETNLLGIAFHYAPSFEERLRLLQLLADHAPTVSDHASKCIRWQKDSLERFKEHEVDEIYELRIMETPDSYEERYLCRSYETALEMIDGFYREYHIPKTSPLASYDIVKRKILKEGDAFCEDHLGECRLSAGKVLVSMDHRDGETENGLCNGQCLDCTKLCISILEVPCPVFIADRAPVLYYEGNGTAHYGIHLNFAHAEELSEYYIIPLESSMLESGDYEEHWDCHRHEHIPCPRVEAVAAEELPAELLQRYHSFTDWLNHKYPHNDK